MRANSLPGLAPLLAVSALLVASSDALAQTCAARSSYRFANGMCNQTGVGELRPGSPVWDPNLPLVVSADNTNTSPQGCFSTCSATARADFGDLSFVAWGSGNNCSCGGIFLWIDEWIGGAPKAETTERVTFSSPTLPFGTPVQIAITMRFFGGGSVNDSAPFYSQSGIVFAGSAAHTLTTPGTFTLIANSSVGSFLDVRSQLMCSMRAQSVQGGTPSSASLGANLRLTTDIALVTPNVVMTRCAGANPACLADLDNGSGTGVRDGGVDVNDLLFFLRSFEMGSLSADLDSDGDPAAATPDGGVDVNDLLYFLARFEIGC